MRSSFLSWAVGFAMLAGWLAVPAAGQLTLPGLGGAGPSADAVRIAAHVTLAPGGRRATLVIRAEIAPGFHIYSITQPDGGPQKTRITLEPSDAYRQAGPFQAAPPPAKHIDREVWVGLVLEEHIGQVTWRAPIALAEGTDPRRLAISGNVDLQACDAGSCVPLKIPFTARLQADRPRTASSGRDAAENDAAKNDEAVDAATPANRPTDRSDAIASAGAAVAGASGGARPGGPVSVGRYAPEGGSVVIEGYVEPAVVAPGGKARLVITAHPESGWHIYARADRDPKEISKPTLIVIDQPDGLTVYRATTDAPVTEKDQRDLGLGIDRYHEGPVTWTVPIEVPEDARPGGHAIAGILGYQVCTDHGCKPPTAARFETTLTVTASGAADRNPLKFSKAKYAQAAALARDLPIPPQADLADDDLRLAESRDHGSLARMLLLAFLGGLILNVMPCVLPVIGLKVMSFVEQSRHNRAQALVLNIWYAVGITSVFLILATLAVVAGMTWGEHFGIDAFNITLAAIVFAMGLSLLGVWEIPIPGFAGGSRAADLSQKEGPGGALLKGVITTVLATPCTGPFMGAALFWAVHQPPLTTYAVFGAMGLGMSSPYLVIGAFPELIRWLPKPGPWMVTFKQLMGFLLLGTVIFLLTFIHPRLIVPTVTLLAGIGAGCWWIARTPATAPFSDRAMAWAGAAVWIALVGLFSFGYLDDVMTARFNRYAQHEGPRRDDELPWQAYTPKRLRQLLASQTTVLVDFTADWCATCKTLEATVLDTQDVRELVRRNRVATLVADYTKRSPQVKEMLTRLKSNGVPVLAIFPADRPNEPIVFRGLYTQSQLLEALERAGPSRHTPSAQATAMDVP